MFAEQIGLSLPGLKLFSKYIIILFLECPISIVSAIVSILHVSLLNKNKSLKIHVEFRGTRWLL